MKVSFSRKGFDSSYGKQANAIMPDGTLLPFPIPEEKEASDKYGLLNHNEQSFFEIISSLKPRTKLTESHYCHLDPDLRRDVKPRLDGWEPAFGQCDSSLSELKNNNFGLGDLFLFFGWFRETEFFKNRLRYKRGAPNLQLIYGYMQVGNIMKYDSDIPEWLYAHPHIPRILAGSVKDAIFLPSKRLSFAPELPGAGMLKYAPELILTAPNMTRSKWKLPDFFKEDSIRIGHAPKQPGNGEYFQSATIGQEMVWEASPKAIEWIKSICSLVV